LIYALKKIFNFFFLIIGINVFLCMKSLILEKTYLM